MVFRCHTKTREVGFPIYACMYVYVVYNTKYVLPFRSQNYCWKYPKNNLI